MLTVPPTTGPIPWILVRNILLGLGLLALAAYFEHAGNRPAAMMAMGAVIGPFLHSGRRRGEKPQMPASVRAAAGTVASTITPAALLLLVHCAPSPDSIKSDTDRLAKIATATNQAHATQCTRPTSAPAGTPAPAICTKLQSCMHDVQDAVHHGTEALQDGAQGNASYDSEAKAFTAERDSAISACQQAGIKE